ncbi:glucosyl-3-phosphoglycerate synthase [Haladaptatus litoreus]|uniref:Glucosyl-3-phosphoglycerate synthase n=1 Tax=Haladaptatus litoreus TaxID=553468 RepID=A0A1N6WHR9_9EURY|nr:glycosyl transferase family 2 [Haladaptatus litoreus]SIQ89562.1 glucosyl-3-phosphoglycerate synthase [Haladaptatus litoreus]
MEYVQEQVTTLHDLTGRVPDAPTDRTAVVVPMTDHEYRSVTASRMLAELESVGPGHVVVPLRAPFGRVGAVRDWLAEFDLPVTLLWCNSPRVTDLLATHGLDGTVGKGRDVWLALGVAASDSEFVVCHDADAKTYSSEIVPRLLAPLDSGVSFTKGYYARVEDGKLYGRLFRLFYAPLVRALREANDEPILSYLDSFRYALSGEFGVTAELASNLRIERDWGLEVGTLGEAFEQVGFDGTAQVDLGRYEHDHRGVSGTGGLSAMSDGVGRALFRVCEANGVSPEYDALPARYRKTANRFVRQYAADAAFNGLRYDSVAEREQVETYAGAIRSPRETSSGLLPAWSDAPIDPADVREAAQPRLPERQH